MFYLLMTILHVHVLRFMATIKYNWVWNSICVSSVVSLFWVFYFKIWIYFSWAFNFMSFPSFQTYLKWSFFVFNTFALVSNEIPKLGYNFNCVLNPAKSFSRPEISLKLLVSERTDCSLQCLDDSMTRWSSIFHVWSIMFLTHWGSTLSLPGCSSWL